MRKNNKKFFSKILIMFIFFSVSVGFISYAADDPVLITGEKGVQITSEYDLLAPLGELKQAPKNIGDYFNTIFNIAIGLCAVLAVIMIVIGGIQYMGSESIFGKTEAKGQITRAILGLIIALGSFALLNTINPDLLGGRGVSVKAVSAEIDLDIHGDTPQGSAINGKYCNGRATEGATWEDSTETTNRTAVKNAGITIQRGDVSCKKVGDRNCTSLSGLEVGPVIKLKSTLCPTCQVVITGGTECWEHSRGTTHFKGSSTVDLDDTPTLNAYIQSGEKQPTNKNGYYIYTKNGTKFLYEATHYHIMSW